MKPSVSRAVEPAADATAALHPFWGTTGPRLLLMSLFWLPVSLFWGAMLGQVLPTRVLAFAGEAHSGRYLAVISMCGAVVGLLTQLFVGPLSDRCASRWGRRKPFLFWGTLLAVGALLAFAQAGSFVGLTLAFMSIQLFLNVANGPYQALLPDLVPPARQGVAAGWVGMMSLLGDAGGPIVAGILLTNAHTDAAQVRAVTTLVEGVSAALLLFMGLTVWLVPDTPAAPNRETLLETMRGTFDLSVRENPDYYRLLLSRAVYNLGFYTALGFLAYYVRFSLGLGENYHPSLTLLQEVAIGGAIVGTVPAGALSDRLGRKKLIYVSSAFSVCAGLAFALAPSIGFATKMALLFGLGFGIFRAVDWAFATSLLPEGGGGKFLGIWSLSSLLPQVAAPLFGPLADWLNHALGRGAGYRGAMFATLLYTIVGTLLVAGVRERPLEVLPRL